MTTLIDERNCRCCNNECHVCKDIIGYQYKWNVSEIKDDSGSYVNLEYITHYDIPGTNKTVFIGCGPKININKKNYIQFYYSTDLKDWDTNDNLKCEYNYNSKGIACDPNTGIFAAIAFGRNSNIGYTDLIYGKINVTDSDNITFSKCNIIALDTYNPVNEKPSHTESWTVAYDGSNEKDISGFLVAGVAYSESENLSGNEVCTTNTSLRYWVKINANKLGKDDACTKHCFHPPSLNSFFRYIYYDKYNKRYIIIGDNNFIAYTNELVFISDSSVGESNRNLKLDVENWIITGEDNTTHFPHTFGNIDSEGLTQYKSPHHQWLTYNPDDNVYVIVGNYGEIYYTNDINSPKWNHCPITYDPKRHLQSIVYDRYNKLYVTVGYDKAILVSKDLNSKWYELSETTPGANYNLQQVYYHDKFGVIILSNGYCIWSKKVEPVKRERLYNICLDAILPVGYQITKTERRNPAMDYRVGVWQSKENSDSTITYTRIV